MKQLNLTGHASFDFIVSDDDGKTYGIECNPRVHSVMTEFYNQPNVAVAYFRTSPSTPILPLPIARET
jgi:D-alanine-D-alanine ligase-like ATP-grasp enzyme